MLGLIVAALVLPASGAAQFPVDQQLGALLQSRVDEGRAVGIVLGLLEADGTNRVVFAGSAGEGARPLGPQTVFEIGSITKVFTGTLLADMARRGEVSLSDPVARHLPRRVRVPSRAAAEITLLDLATHRSALPRLPTNLEPADRTNPYADYTVEQLYAFLSSHELRRGISAEFEYSNLGVGLLGHALSRAAGVSYETLVQRRILEPLGMSMTGITLEGDMRDWMANGHNQRGNVVPLWDLPTLAGAGALRSDVLDMLRFLDANIGEPRSELEESMRAAHVPQAIASLGEGPAEQSIGLNWLISWAGDATIVWHGGATAGFTTFVGFDPDRQVGVVVLGNMGRAGVADIGLHLLSPNIPLSEPAGWMGGWSVTVLLVCSAVGLSILLIPLWGRFRNSAWRQVGSLQRSGSVAFGSGKG